MSPRDDVASCGDITRPAEINLDGRTVYIAAPNEDDYIGRVIRESGEFYEREFLDFLRGLLAPDDLVLDVGANIGNHAVFFALACKARVIAYEPVGVTADVLRHNIDLNFLDASIEHRRQAVGASAGRAAIDRFNPANVGQTSLALDHNGDIEVVALDSEVLPARVALIKIDVEGMDVDVLRGASALIARDRPFITCEVSDPTTRPALDALVEEIHYCVIGEYNATPSLVLAPADGARELKEALRHVSRQAVDLQGKVSRLEARLDQATRYVNRLHQEVLAKLGDLSSVIEGLDRK